MQTFDIFIAPIPGFDGDIPILAIIVSAQPPGDESTSDPSTRASASRTRACKQKACQAYSSEKAKKTTGRSLSGIKINEPTQGSCFDSSIRSLIEDPNPLIKKVYLS
jgi:hypothetical protein